jgi:hypothetical protein
VFPKYKKALFCLSRAETLAAGDNDFQTAGEAALSQGGMEPDQQKKLTHLQRATDYFLQVERADLATRAANARVRASRSASDVLASRLIAAKARYQSGDEVKALDEMREIAAQADRSKVRLGEDYAVIAAETNFLIADDDRLQFEDYNLFDRGGDPISHINQKAKYFENLARNLDKVARLEVPEWSSQARYNLASAAEQFAQDVLTVKTKSDSKLGPKAQDKLNQTAQRLQRMAKRYFGENLLARNRNPALYRDNPWVKKSMFRLAAYQKLDEKPQFEEELQASLRLDIPQNWSL